MANGLFANDKDARDKVEKAKDILRTTYYANSSVAQIVNVKDATPEEEEFLQLGFRHYIPREWFTRKDIFIEIALEQIARNLATSEEKYVVDQILKVPEIPSIELGEDILRDFLERYKAFSENQIVQALLIPIDFYVNLHTDWLAKTSDIKMDLASGELTICGTKPHIFWSNKYIPFDDFVLIDKRFGEWTSKPTFKDRLEVRISESDKQDKLDLLYVTKMKFGVIDPTKILILHRISAETE